jgi:hypothetical protein
MAKGNTMMLRDLLLKAGPKRKTVEVDGVGQVTVRGLTAGEATKFHQLQVSDVSAAAYHLLTSAVLDEKGNQMFSEADVEKLADVDSDIVNTLVRAVLEVAKLVPSTPEKK